MGTPAIRAEKVGKHYRLGNHPNLLAERLGHGLDRLMGRRARPPHSGGDAAAGGGPLDLWALRDVSLEVQPGEVVGLIGRNGAGKSTLLKLLSRITPPSEGRIELRGRVGTLLEVGTGFHPELTGRENIFLSGTILGMSRREIQRQYDVIVEFSGVQRFIETPVKRYSSGMYVRLAFAVAAHLEPEILLVDEVLAVGDAEFQRKCLGKMHDIAAGEGRTIVFVSHNLAAVQRLCQRSYWFEQGRLAAQGPSRDVAGPVPASPWNHAAGWRRGHRARGPPHDQRRGALHPGGLGRRRGSDDRPRVAGAGVRRGADLRAQGSRR